MYSILELRDDYLKLEISKMDSVIDPETSDKNFLGGQGLTHRFISANMSLPYY